MPIAYEYDAIKVITVNGEKLILPCNHPEFRRQLEEKRWFDNGFPFRHDCIYNIRSPRQVNSEIGYTNFYNRLGNGYPTCQVCGRNFIVEYYFEENEYKVSEK